MSLDDVSLEDILKRILNTRLSAGIQLAFLQNIPPASAAQIEAAEQKLGVVFHPDYRRFLEVASHRLFGPFDPAMVSLPGSKLDLVTAAEEAWNQGAVPRDGLPICRHGDGFFCLDSEGRIEHWPAPGDRARVWKDLASWLAEMAFSEPVQTSGNPRIDEILSGVIDLFESSFPGRIHSYYLDGSHADGQTVGSSDMDVTVLFETQPNAEETRRIARVRVACQKLCPPLDIRVRGRDTAERFGTYGFNLRSLRVRGEDARGNIPPTPLEDYYRVCVHAPYYFMCALLRGQRQGVPHPFDYPDPNGEFFGYNRPMRRALDGVERDGLKDLTVCILWAARAFAVLRARQHLSPRNSEGAKLYREWIGDEWSPWLEGVVELCRNTWHYVVPKKAAERDRLRRMCARALDFENHYLDLYREFLIDQLDHATKPESFWIGLGNPGPDGFDEATARLFALKRLAQLRYGDTEVHAALTRASQSEDPRIREAALEILTGNRRHSAS